MVTFIHAYAYIATHQQLSKASAAQLCSSNNAQTVSVLVHLQRPSAKPLLYHSRKSGSSESHSPDRSALPILWISRNWCTCCRKMAQPWGCKNPIKWLPESKKQSTYQLPILKPLPESPGSLKRDCWKLGKATAKRISEAQVGLNLKPEGPKSSGSTMFQLTQTKRAKKCWNRTASWLQSRNNAFSLGALSASERAPGSVETHTLVCCHPRNWGETVKLPKAHCNCKHTKNIKKHTSNKKLKDQFQRDYIVADCSWLFVWKMCAQCPADF